MFLKSSRLGEENKREGREENMERERKERGKKHSGGVSLHLRGYSECKSHLINQYYKVE